MGLGIELTIAPMASMAVSGVKYVPLEYSTPLPFGLCWRSGFYDKVEQEFIKIAQRVAPRDLSGLISFHRVYWILS